MSQEAEKKSMPEQEASKEPKQSEKPKDEKPSDKPLTKEEMKKTMLANFQVLDAQMNLCKLDNRELAIAKTKLEECWMWFEKAVDLYEAK